MTAVDERLEWLGRRRTGLGASDVAAILGLSPWTSPWSLWADKVGLLPLDAGDTDEMRFGRWLELAVGPWFAHETGLLIGSVQEELTHPEHPWARCTLDGKVYDGPEADFHDGTRITYGPDVVSMYRPLLGGLEIKTTGPSRRWDEIPPHYQCQGQWQMFVGDLDRVWFATLHGRRLEIYELERDDADIELLHERAEEFWTVNVEGNVPPPVDGSDATLDALAAVYPDSHDRGGIELDHDLVAGYAAARVYRLEAEKKEAELKARIQVELGDEEIGLVAGVKRISWKTQTARRLDGASLKVAMPEVHARYQTESTSRVLRTHNPKGDR